MAGATSVAASLSALAGAASVGALAASLRSSVGASGGSTTLPPTASTVLAAPSMPRRSPITLQSSASSTRCVRRTAFAPIVRHLGALVWSRPRRSPRPHPARTSRRGRGAGLSAFAVGRLPQPRRPVAHPAQRVSRRRRARPRAHLDRPVARHAPHARCRVPAPARHEPVARGTPVGPGSPGAAREPARAVSRRRVPAARRPAPHARRPPRRGSHRVGVRPASRARRIGRLARRTQGRAGAALHQRRALRPRGPLAKAAVARPAFLRVRSAVQIDGRRRRGAALRRGSARRAPPRLGGLCAVARRRRVRARDRSPRRSPRRHGAEAARRHVAHDADDHGPGVAPLSRRARLATALEPRPRRARADRLERRRRRRLSAARRVAGRRALALAPQAARSVWSPSCGSSCRSCPSARCCSRSRT